MQATDGDIPEAAQAGLKDTLKSQGYFMACSCEPETPLHIVTAETESLRSPCSVIEHQLFNDNVLRLRLSSPADFNYHAGQYITLWKDDSIGRSYSLASVAELDDYLELHIRIIPDGIVSAWLHNEINVGDEIQIQAATGDCFYVPGSAEQKILLGGTGTGLAPLIGIERDALRQGHCGEIHLVHGTREAGDLYLHQTLLDMAMEYNQFHYYASVLQADNAQAPVSTVPLDQQLIDIGDDLADCKFYLCGDPDMINNLKRKLFIAGASIKNIYSDPFISANDE